MFSPTTTPTASGCARPNRYRRRRRRRRRHQVTLASKSRVPQLLRIAKGAPRHFGCTSIREHDDDDDDDDDDDGTLFLLLLPTCRRQ